MLVFGSKSTRRLVQANAQAEEDILRSHKEGRGQLHLIVILALPCTHTDVMGLYHGTIVSRMHLVKDTFWSQLPVIRR